MTGPRKQFQQYLKKLEDGFSGRISERAPMKRHTTFRIGGFAEVMVWPASRLELERAAALADSMGLPWRIIGAGSNLLVLDGGLDEVLINLSDLREGIEPADVETGLAVEELAAGGGTEKLVRLSAGSRLTWAVKLCQERGLAGLEFAAGIPGSVGGAAIMNAGSQGSCMAEVIHFVEWMRPGKKPERKSRAELDYQYRRLNRPGDVVVTAVGLRLAEDDPKKIRERIVKGLKWRRQHQPLSYPSAGSVFKNPEGDYAGRLIEEAGLKGRRLGDAQISELHANFIVNRGRARSREVIELIDLARESVLKKFGLELELELEIIGKELP